jgi:hypothetical protein
MALKKLDPHKVQLGKTYAHASGRRFMAFHFAVGSELEVELLEQTDMLPIKRYMPVVDFEEKIKQGVLTRQD